MNSQGEVIQERESLYDLLKKDEEGLVENDFETIRLAMTDGQIGVANNVGLAFLLRCESSIYGDSVAEYFENSKETYEQKYGSDPISVYHGVDISIFIDPSRTALTSDAFRAIKENETSNFGVDSGTDTSENSIRVDIISDILVGVLFLSLATSVGALLLKYRYFKLFGDLVTPTKLTSVANMFDATMYIAIIIFVIVLILWLVIDSYYGDTEDENTGTGDIEYTKIPRAIVALKNAYVDGVGDQNVYYTYTCAERIDADKNSSNTLNIYGDLNQYNKKNQWVAVYYTKNRDCGKPITSDVVLSESQSCPEGYVALHEFGSDTAADLNKFNSGENKKSIYGYVKTTTFETKSGNDGTQGMSVFSAGTTVMLSVAAFAAGAVASGFITYSGTKKKYKKA